MATTQNTYTGNGNLVQFSFTFPYLDEAEIKVSLDGVDVATSEYSLANATTVEFNTAPTNGQAIRIYRETGVEALQATFFSGSAIRAQDLNNNFNQVFYSTQETVNRRLDRTGGTMSGELSMGSNKITDVTDPTDDQDAATKSYVDTADALKVAKAGDTMSGNLAMGSNKITGLGTPTASTDASTKAYADTKLPLAGGTMSGAIAMGSSKITGVGTPTDDGDAATKLYVDNVALAAIPDSNKGDITVTNSGTTWTIADDAVTSDKIGPNIAFTGTEGITIPSGTELERNQQPVNGMLRYSTTDNAFEGYADGEWGAIGGGGGFEVSTTPPADPEQGTTYWDSEEGNAYIYYQDGSSNQWVPLVPSTPPKSAEGGGTDEVFFLNDTAVTTNYELPTGKNALSAGPITINSGITVEIPNGQSWVIV